MKNTSTKPSTTLHIGDALQSYIKTNHISQAALARALGVQANTVLSYTQKASIATKTLWQICHKLKHNFFLDIAQQLPTSFESNYELFKEKDAQIAELQQRIEKLETEKAILMQVRG